MKLHWKHEQENYMSFDIEQVCSFLRAQKEQVVKKSNDQSMLPIVVVERDESPVAIIISPFYLFIVDNSLTLKGFQ